MNQSASEAAGVARLGLGEWRFGDAVLHEPGGRLVVAGNERMLDRSSHQILRYLLEHSGEVVTKEELLEAGWPARVVGENSLAKAISRLRLALGPSADMLRAVHGYGYRLNGPAAFTATPTPAAALRGMGAELPPLGGAVPGRTGWTLTRQLGEGAAGITFLMESRKGEQRVVKFARDLGGLRGLKREIALSRYIEAAMAERSPVARVLGWNLEQPPCYLELPYFADGNLDVWAGACGGLGALSHGQRLDLFAALCDAVAGLHEIGVIHKDLKPENLYPRPDGEGGWKVVLSDLGASEAAPSPQLAGLGLTLGVAGGGSPQAGSLLYLAPELIAGEAATQRSDVFSLGVLLYQLAVGDLRRALAPGWEHDIDDPLLQEDIALAAAARPERRLVDARTLAERVRSLPARRAARDEERQRAEAARLQGLQLQKLQQRRRWLQAGMAVLGAVLLVSLWQQQRVETARAAMEVASRQARENAAIADAVNRFFNEDVLAAASPYASGGRREPTLREAIDQAVEHIDRRLADQPVVEATVRMTIGQVYGESMQIARAIEQERRAVALFEQHLGREDPRTQQARYRLATDLTDDSRFDEARSLIEATDAVRTRLRQDDAETTLLSHRANCYWYIWRQQYDRGQPACEGAIAAQLRVDPQDHIARIKARTNLAVLHSRAGRFEQAERQFDRIAQEFATLEDRGSPTWLRASYLHGMNLLALGRHEEAGRLLDEVFAGSIRALGADNPHTLEVQVGLARSHLAQARPSDAVPLLEHAYGAYRRQLGEDNHYTRAAGEDLRAARCAAGQDSGPSCG